MALHGQSGFAMNGVGSVQQQDAISLRLFYHTLKHTREACAFTRTNNFNLAAICPRNCHAIWHDT